MGQSLWRIDTPPSHGWYFVSVSRSGLEGEFVQQAYWDGIQWGWGDSFMQWQWLGETAKTGEWPIDLASSPSPVRGWQELPAAMHPLKPAHAAV
jgi:hypothetical protein